MVSASEFALPAATYDTPETTPKPTKTSQSKPLQTLLQTLLQTETPMTMRATVQTRRPPPISDTPNETAESQRNQQKKRHIMPPDGG